MRTGTLLLGLCLLMWLSGCNTEKREGGTEKEVRAAFAPEKTEQIKPDVQVKEEAEEIEDSGITKDEDYLERPEPAEEVEVEGKEGSKELTSEEIERRDQAAKEAAKKAEEAGDEAPKPKQEEFAPPLTGEEEKDEGVEEGEELEVEETEEVDEEAEGENEDTETDDSENKEEVGDKDTTPPDVN